MTTETMEMPQATEPIEPTKEELEQAVAEATRLFEEATKLAEDMRFDRKASMDDLKAAVGKKDIAERNLNKAKSAIDRANSAERMAELEGMTRALQEAVRPIILENLDKLLKLEVKGYTVAVTGLGNDTGPEVTASPRVPSEVKAKGTGGTRKAKTTYAGMNARDFITSRGPEKWDAARVAKILDDPNNLNHYARTLAKALNIEPEQVA